MYKVLGKKLGEFVFDPFEIIVIQYRMLERHYLNLEIVLYTWVEHTLYDKLLEGEVGGIMIIYIDVMFEQGNVSAYMKRIWPTLVCTFPKDVTKLRRVIRCEAPQ